jgi:hypothetical protein
VPPVATRHIHIVNEMRATTRAGGGQRCVLAADNSLPTFPGVPTISRRFQVILAFALVYVFWGSTYLGIRIAVERVPPILMADVS